ncbi:MAG: pseudouridine synthase [Candidatus Omnitrophica bacterium]|jgi:23S rRNA pseudouridine2605 synthase|nr:pseudouridine synthase [Candidatus Omnitrophota bacterium]MDD4013827.1 pseudouridine synthase [Candidatus Omnitrophota bacterium]
MKERLQNILAKAGVASRRSAGDLISSGRVTVDGVRVSEKGFRLEQEGHSVEVDGKPISANVPKLYFLLNKPKGVITTARDTHDRKTVADLFEKEGARLFTIGRLDKDTTGVLIVTNDGDLAHRLSHPSFEIDKEYEALVEGPIGPREVRRLERGVKLDGKQTSPCLIVRIGERNGAQVFRLRIHEGRKRQVRRMFEKAGGVVTDLKRIRYAGLETGKLKEGEYRKLTDKEIDILKRSDI